MRFLILFFATFAVGCSGRPDYPTEQPVFAGEAPLSEEELNELQARAQMAIFGYSSNWAPLSLAAIETEFDLSTEEGRRAYNNSLEKIHPGEFIRLGTQAGFELYQLERMARIAWCESRLKPQAIGELTPDDRGLFQISLKNHYDDVIEMFDSEDLLFVPEHNFKFAAVLARRQMESNRSMYRDWYLSERCHRRSSTRRAVREYFGDRFNAATI